MSANEIRDESDERSVESSRRLIEGMCADARVENRAIAARLAKIGELFDVRLAEYGEEEDCAVDTWAAVGAEVAAALRCSRAMASSYLHYAVSLRDALPKVAEVFSLGDIDFRTVQAIVYRTALIEDKEKIAEADKRLALRAPRWGSLSDSRLAAAIDRVVRHIDQDAVRRNGERFSNRELNVSDIDDGPYSVSGSVFAADGKALDARLEALAATVCDADPRTRKERRADALGVLATGGERLSCRCGQVGCPAGGIAPGGPNVTIHIVAENGSVVGRSQRPGYLVDDNELIPAEMVAQLAHEAKLRPLVSPVDAPPESGYTPSQKLADFVRCRDLTCRAPGCDVPAFQCDIDHTVPYGDGGLTHASNLKCECRTHHRLKTSRSHNGFSKLLRGYDNVVTCDWKQPARPRPRGVNPAPASLTLDSCQIAKPTTPSKKRQPEAQEPRRPEPREVPQSERRAPQPELREVPQSERWAARQPEPQEQQPQAPQAGQPPERQAPQEAPRQARQAEQQLAPQAEPQPEPQPEPRAGQPPAPQAGQPGRQPVPQAEPPPEPRAAPQPALQAEPQPEPRQASPGRHRPASPAHRRQVSPGRHRPASPAHHPVTPAHHRQAPPARRDLRYSPRVGSLRLPQSSPPSSPPWPPSSFCARTRPSREQHSNHRRQPPAPRPAPPHPAQPLPRGHSLVGRTANRARMARTRIAAP